MKKFNLENVGGCRNDTKEMVESKYGKYIETSELIELLQEFKLVSKLNKNDGIRLMENLLEDLQK